MQHDGRVYISPADHRRPDLAAAVLHQLPHHDGGRPRPLQRRRRDAATHAVCSGHDAPDTDWLSSENGRRRTLRDRGRGFPEGGDGRRSTTATGRAIFADSRPPAWTQRSPPASSTRPTGAAATSARCATSCTAAAMIPQAALTISTDGLESAHRRFVFARDGEQTAAVTRRWRHRPTAASARSRCRGPSPGDRTHPALPRPAAVRRRPAPAGRPLGRSRASPSRASPRRSTWCSTTPTGWTCSDVDIAILGAGAEMGPTRSLLRWGATVHAIDLPRPDLWQRLIATTRSTAGHRCASRSRSTSEASRRSSSAASCIPTTTPTVAAKAGADLLRRTPSSRAGSTRSSSRSSWAPTRTRTAPAHVLLSMAADASRRPARPARRHHPGLPGHPHRRLHGADGRGRGVPPPVGRPRHQRTAAEPACDCSSQFEPNYPQDYVTPTPGIPFGINDSLVPAAGPELRPGQAAPALARAGRASARARQCRSTWRRRPARSRCVKNRALAAAYAGAGRFGVEVFDPATSTTLMAALLVHDLRNPAAAANPATALANPMDLFAQGANHGGLWRAAYSPRSVLGFAAVLGMFDVPRLTVPTRAVASSMNPLRRLRHPRAAGPARRHPRLRDPRRAQPAVLGLPTPSAARGSSASVTSRRPDTRPTGCSAPPAVPAAALLTSGPGAANILAAFGEAFISGSAVIAIASEVEPGAAVARRAARASCTRWPTRARCSPPSALRHGLPAPARRRSPRPCSPCATPGDPRRSRATSAYRPTSSASRGRPPSRTSPACRRRAPIPHDVTDAGGTHRASHRDVVLWLGGGVVASDAEEAARALAHRLGAPVVTSYAGRGLLAGDPLLVDAPVHEPEVSAGRSPRPTCSSSSARPSTA